MSAIDVELALQRLDGDRELLEEIWKDFSELTPAQMDEIEASHKEGRLDDLHREAHSLKSTAGSVGAMGLYEVAKYHVKPALNIAGTSIPRPCKVSSRKSSLGSIDRR